MAYSAVPTKNTGDTWSAADNNTYIKDNMAAMAPDVFTTKGDLFVATGADAAARLAVGTDGQRLTADSTQATGVKWASATEQTAYARYAVNATQTVASNSATILNYHASVYDTDSAVTTGADWKFTVPASHDGYYSVFATALIQSIAGWGAGEYAYLAVFKNNSEVCRIAQETMQAAGTYGVFLSGGTVISLAAADYIDVRLYHNNGSTVTIDGTGAYTHVAIAKML